ncbi:MAG TPA: hypothetical protein VK465_10795 [Fibrobacteria bacterium]|nr:hypothetical protein [Fibrobacteria bacterium]
MSDLNPIQFGPLPRASMASVSAPSLEDTHSPARDTTHNLPPLPGGPSAAPSPPGLGLTLDIYDTLGPQGVGVPEGGKPAETLEGIQNSEFNQGLSTAETIVPPPDFPYLKPLGTGVGKAFNAVI